MVSLPTCSPTTPFQPVLFAARPHSLYSIQCRLCGSWRVPWGKDFLKSLLQVTLQPALWSYSELHQHEIWAAQYNAQKVGEDMVKEVSTKLAHYQACTTPYSISLTTKYLSPPPNTLLPPSPSLCTALCETMAALVQDRLLLDLNRTSYQYIWLQSSWSLISNSLGQQSGGCDGRMDCILRQLAQFALWNGLDFLLCILFNDQKLLHYPCRMYVS